ncbi:cytochrome P450 [Paracoccaceae bacterium]|nr:cytochrome P450 [Paracoccaceae bacterium]
MENKPIYNIDVTKFKRNPYPDLKEMRAVNPICFVPQVNATMICDRDSIYECEKNTTVFSSVQPQGLMTILMGQNMMRKDGEAHAEERKTIFKTISPKTSRDFWRDRFAIIADEIIEKIQKLKSGDLLTLYAKELSAECLKLVTGLTNMTAAEMDRVSQGMIDGCSNYTGDSNIEKYCNDCTESIDAHINEIVGEINRKSDFSMISTMLEGKLNASQISANIKLAISGGQNEPRDAIAGCIWAALNFKLKERLLEINNWDQLFNEYCRWMSPIGMSPREIAKDYSYKNITFKKGDRVFLMFSSANRDEKVFNNAEKFDLERDCTKSIHFGAGPHYCAGASIATTMISLIALPKLFRALPKLRLVDKEKYEFDGWAFRGINSLECAW